MLELSDEERLPRSWRIASGPDVLAEAVRRLGLPYSRTHVRSLINTKKPQVSVRLLAEAARTIGLEAHLGEIEVADLESPAPGVVLLCGFRQRGFGLIEAVTADHITVWDPVYASRALSRAQFQREFSGLLLLLERPDGYQAPTVEKRRGRQRLVEFFWEELRLRTDLAGPQASRALPFVLLTLMVALLLFAGLSGSPVSTAVLGGLAVGGVALSYAMLRGVYGGSKAVDVLCGGAHSGCNDLLRSKYAKVLGVPAAGLGFAFFVAQVVVVSCVSAGPFVAGVLAAAAVPEAALMVWLMVRVRRFCRLCAVVHAINLVSAAYFLGVLATPLPPAAQLLQGGVVWLAVFLLTLSGVVPHLVHADRSALLEAELEAVKESPWWLGREISKAVPIPGDPSSFTFPVTPPTGRYDLWALAGIDCPTCSLAMRALQAWIARDRGRQIRVRLGVIKSLTPSLAEAVAAVGLATDGHRAFDAYWWAKEMRENLVGRADVYPDMAKAMGLPLELLEAQRARAASIPGVADDTCSGHSHQAGVCFTPFVVLEGRRLETSFLVIERLLEDNPELLRLASGLPAPERPHAAEAGHATTAA